MESNAYYPKLRRIAEEYGYDAQSRQLIEEMAELTVAINKIWRLEQTQNSEKFCLTFYNLSMWKRKNELTEEIADVEIMLSQIKYLLDCNEEVEQEKERKILRQLERIKGEVEGE